MAAIVLKYDLKGDTKGAGISILASCGCVIGTIGHVIVCGEPGSVADRIMFDIGMIGALVGVGKFVYCGRIMK